MIVMWVVLGFTYLLASATVGMGMMSIAFGAAEKQPTSKDVVQYLLLGLIWPYWVCYVLIVSSWWRD